MKISLITLMCLLMPLGLFGSNTKEAQFWTWFKSNENDLYEFEKDQERVFTELSGALHKVHPDLTFEFSPIRKDGRREFVISAGGHKRAFPAVESLHAAAPALAQWTFLKFRQRRFPINDLEFAEKKIRSEDVHYAIFKDENPEKVGIMIFLDGYREEDRGSIYGQMGYLFLDEAIGEYDVEMHVGAIVFFDRDSKHFKHARPLAELPDHFDERLGRK